MDPTAVYTDSHPYIPSFTPKTWKTQTSLTTHTPTFGHSPHIHGPQRLLKYPTPLHSAIYPHIHKPQSLLKHLTRLPSSIHPTYMDPQASYHIPHEMGSRCYIHALHHCQMRCHINNARYRCQMRVSDAKYVLVPLLYDHARCKMHVTVDKCVKLSLRTYVQSCIL